VTQDRFRYFRIEAADILTQLTQGALDLEKQAASGTVVPRLLRLAHTLKGAARVVQQREIADCAHALEDVLAAPKEAAAPSPSDRRMNCSCTSPDLLESSAVHSPAIDGEADARLTTAGPTAAITNKNETAISTATKITASRDRLLDGK